MRLEAARNKLPKATELPADMLDYIVRDAWRILGIMSEFVTVPEKLNQIRPGVSVFWSARFKLDRLYRENIERIARLPPDTAFSAIPNFDSCETRSCNATRAECECCSIPEAPGASARAAEESACLSGNKTAAERVYTGDRPRDASQAACRFTKFLSEVSMKFRNVSSSVGPLAAATVHAQFESVKAVGSVLVGVDVNNVWRVAKP